MSATTEAQHQLEQVGRRVHPTCFVCGHRADIGLGLRFISADDGGVAARFMPEEVFCGYADILHGGITSAILDGAMTNCLFARGIVAVTAELIVRFRHPIGTASLLTVCARIQRAQEPLYVLEAELAQNGQVKARAVGKFIHRPRER